MSKTKEYLNNLEDQGVDVFSDDNKDLDLEFQEEELLKDAYYWWTEELNARMSEEDDSIPERWK